MGLAAQVRQKMSSKKAAAANKSPLIRVTSAHSAESATNGQSGAEQQLEQVLVVTQGELDGRAEVNLVDQQAGGEGAASMADSAELGRASQQQQQHQVQLVELGRSSAKLESSSTSNEQSGGEPAARRRHQEATHAYSARWLVLAIFCSHSAINSFQWIQYPIISNIVTTYYQVGYQAVNLTSMVYMLVYIPFIVHASLMLERVGLRSAICLGATGTALGSIIKLLFGSAPSEHAFWAMMLGQTVVALSQLYIISIPPLLAAVWFPDHQVSTATGIGVFGNQLGIALGSIVPPMLVSGTQAPIELIGNELYSLSFGVAVVSVIVCLLAFACLQDKPPKPPGSASLHAEHQHQEQLAAEAAAAAANSREQIDVQNSSKYKTETFASIKQLCRDRDFKLLTLSYGINVGVYYAISTVLNQMLSKSWTNPDDLSGTMGLLLVVSGMVGSVMCGQLLDYTHAYKLIIVLIYLLSLVSMLIFTIVLKSFTVSPWPLYLASITLGFFMTGYLPLGFEFAAELTYPHPANTPAGLLNLSAQVFGLALTYASSVLVEQVDGEVWSNVFLTICLVIGLVMTFVMKANLKRQQAVAEEQLKI